MTHTDWHCYFLANKNHFDHIAWSDGPELTGDESLVITRSIQQFQKGENSEGKHLIRFAKRHRDATYLSAITDLIREEQTHSLVLGRFMESNGIPKIRSHWVDTIFRKLRQFGNLENSIRVLISAEIIAAVFYQALHDATNSPTLKAICKQILRDEEMHINFQSFTLKTFFARKSLVGKLWTRTFHRMLMIGTTIVVWLTYFRLLTAGGFTMRSFQNKVFREYARAMRMVRGADEITIRAEAIGQSLSHSNQTR